MMTERFPPQLRELHAYVDGQLSPESQRRVESWLASNPEAKRQAEDYGAIRQGLQALYDPVLQEQIPTRLRRRPRRWLRPIVAMAAAVVLLVTGAWIGPRLQDSTVLPLAGSPHVVREAAMAYAIYTPEVRHPVEVPGSQEQHLVAWLTKRMGARIRVPHLDTLGFGLVGGRLLASEDGPGALLMYENVDGQRVVLYACENENQGRNTAFRFARQDRISVFFWFDGPLSYALAGEFDRDGMLELAEAVYRQIII